MDLKTAVAILNQQVQETSVVVNILSTQASQVSYLADQSNQIADPVAQIKSLMASMTIQMAALNSQDVIVQQCIDRISEILASVSIPAS